MPDGLFSLSKDSLVNPAGHRENRGRITEARSTDGVDYHRLPLERETVRFPEVQAFLEFFNTGMPIVLIQISVSKKPAKDFHFVSKLRHSVYRCVRDMISLNAQPNPFYSLWI